LLEISDEAGELILAMLANALEGRPELRRGKCKPGLRLNFRSRGAHLSLAFPRASDQVLCFMGRPLLIVDHADLAKLDGVRLQVLDGPGGPMLSMVPVGSEAAAPRGAAGSPGAV